MAYELTIAQVSSITGIPHRMILSQIRSKHLKGFRVPGSQEYRVPVCSLRQWIAQNGIPSDKCNWRISITTGQARLLTGVGWRILTNHFDSGKLKGFRIPGSTSRRIPVASLREWMIENHIPTDNLDLAFPELVPHESLEK
jgi:hypothetical protein